MQAQRLTLPLLLAILALLLAACTSTEALLATQGFGHFNAKSVTIDIGSGSGGGSLVTQIVDPSTGALPVNATGIAQGIGSEVYNLRLTATGDPLVSCTNQGGNQAPGQNPAVTVLDDSAVGGDPSNRNGKYEFDVANAIDPLAIVSATACPNDNWTARLDFIFWTEVWLELENSEGFVTDEIHFDCTTTLTSISCSRQ